MKEIHAHNQYEADYIRRNLFDEDDEIILEGSTEISYSPIPGTPYVDFFVDDQFFGVLEVWNDSGNDEDPEREYVCINHEIRYLDEMAKEL